MECRAFHDALHGIIVLHPLCLKVIDTIEFQRLRKIKQLGNASLVFPSATHTRFEHSLGVAWLAGRLIRVLADAHPELAITPREMLCIELAGLLHDVGHGIMSHTFDMFIAQTDKVWKHEDTSATMVRAICENIQVAEGFKHYGIHDCIDFIINLIHGNFDTERSFLWDIVANTRTGNDVDKWDYLQRDAQMLGVRIPFTHGRLLHFARVVTLPCGQTAIAYPDKVASDVTALFASRTVLHETAYRHRVTRALDLMTVDALVSADPFFMINVDRMSESIHNPLTYSAMTDSILDQLLFSTDKDLQPSRELLMRIQERDLYSCIHEITVTNDAQVAEFYEYAMTLITPDTCIICDVCTYAKERPSHFFRTDRMNGTRTLLPDARHPQLEKRVCRIYDKQSREVR